MKIKQKYCTIAVKKNNQGVWKKHPNFKKTKDGRWGSMSKSKANASFIEIPKGMYVVDIDTKKIPKKYKAFMKALGSPTVETANGFHYYIQSFVPLTTQQNIFKDDDFKVDIKTEGGLIFTSYWGKSDHVWYKKVGKMQEDPKYKIFKMLPTYVREGGKKIKTVERGDVGKTPLKNIKDALDRVDIKDYSTEESWFHMLASIYHGGGAKAEELARNWSKGDGDSYDKEAFDTKWDRLLSADFGEDISVGSLFDAAKGEEAADSFGKEKGSVQPISKKEKKKRDAKRDIKKLEGVEDRGADMKKQEIGLEYNPDHFPNNISQYMEHAATQLSLNFSAAVPYTMMMLSQLIGDKVKVKMNNAWTHTPIIWGLNIAGAGVGKSPLMKKLSSPIWDIQKTMKNKYDRDMEMYKLEMSRFVRDLKQGSVTVEDEPKKPKIKMIVMDEFTPEALYDQLEDNPNGVTVWKDELKGMFIQNEKSEILRTKMISAWSGQNITRNTKTQGVNILVNPYVRVGGNVQPEVVKKIITDNKSGFNADGFIVRFALVAHLKKLGFHWNVENNLFAKDAFTNACKKLNKSKKEKLLIFNKAGEEMVEEFMKQTNKQVDEASSNFEKEFLSKLGSLFGSLMVIIHQLNEKPKEVVISSQTIRNAISIAETATLNAFHLYSIEKRETQETEDAEILIIDWLKKSGRKYFEKNKGTLTASKIRDVLNKKVTSVQIAVFFEDSDKFEVRRHGRGVNISVL